MSEIKKPWQRRDDEPAKAYTAFKMWVKMGYRRGVRAVANELGMSGYTAIIKWRDMYEWDARLEAFEDYELDLWQRGKLRLALNHKKEQLKQASELRNKVMRTLPNHRVNVSTREMSRVLWEMSRLERLILDEEIEKAGINIHQPIDLSSLTDEELNILEKAANRTAAEKRAVAESKV